MDPLPKPKNARDEVIITTITALSPLYHFFFLYLEPFSALVGAYCAFILPHTYLRLTHAPSAPTPPPTGATLAVVPTGTSVSLAQLANLYVLFAINEGLVLRSTRDLYVWRTLLFGLLLADLGHLFSVRELGLPTYYAFWNWNAMDTGNVGFVYVGALMRLCFLAGVGVQSQTTSVVATARAPSKPRGENVQK